MKFSDMKYERPELDAIKRQYIEITRQFPDCSTASEQYDLILQHEKLMSNFQSMGTIAYIRNSINTVDPFYEKEIAFFDSNNPVFEESVQNFYKVIVASKFRPELEQKTGKLFFKNLEISMRSFSPAVIDLKKKENALVTEYEKLLASAKIEFSGETLNLSEIQKYQISSDRPTRKAAWEKTAGFFIENSKRLDEIYDELVQNRTSQAKILGYNNYVQLGYDRLGRNCYGPDEVKQFRDQVAKDLVPVITEIKKSQAKRLGLPDLKFYDDKSLFPDGNPNPKGDRQALVNQAQKMYRQMNPLTGEFFDFMVKNELFDLDSKKGKAGGGYCTEIPDYRSPFIFSNFNGTAGDVEVLTHEAGHAFASYLSQSMPILELRTPTMDAAETHSMSMELFSRKWDPLFFEEQTDKFYLYQLEEAINFIPYGCLVDEFQTTMYEKPNLSPDERKHVWKELEAKYRPWINFDHLPFFEDGGGYQRQHHIYSFPLYYIDYCLAQTAALEFWIASEKDWDESFSRYLTFVKAGGSKTYEELVKAAGLEYPMDQGCVKHMSEPIMDWFRRHA
ncbi:M3 family oligoendopeptidase [Caproicibacter fermentans]|uniref:M3 family oligoendopeptidase n=1 Tax=Caproicibacter fermentans TaxID=2576756 RepID=A0A7G8TBF4_9FIRM|nr:M3 family oligoendopeptidase [Caproicibacter fermentans]QNK40945.1 M3 family oligoendopeptidase [Caproicibacter fermentans]